MFRNKNKSKVKVKTAKGGGPIRKVKFAIGAGVVVSGLKALFGDAIPEDLLTPVANWIVESADLIAALAAAYFTSPGHDDGITAA